MRDLLMLLLTGAFFALCVAYVQWCDRIIGPDPAEPSTGEPQREGAATIERNEVSA